MPAVADGSNADDRGELPARPPGRPRVRRHQPARRGRLSKDELRALSPSRRAADWDEPASACLSSRIPYFSEVTDQKLRTIEAAEAVVARTSGSGSAACGITTRSPGSNSGRTRISRALDPEVAASIDRELRALATST